MVKRADLQLLEAAGDLLSTSTAVTSSPSMSLPRAPRTTPTGPPRHCGCLGLLDRGAF